MNVQLIITEKPKEKGARHRKRVISINTESITLGNHSSADIDLVSFSSAPLLIEIKSTESGWWVLNPLRHPHIMVNGEPLSLEKPLQDSSEILVEGYKMIFEKTDCAVKNPPFFKYHPENDEALWQFFLKETDFDEILINGISKIYVDWRGQLFKSPWLFSSHQFLLDKVFYYTKVKSEWSSWRLHRTLRIQAALPPLVEEPHISIRKAKQHVLSLDQLLKTQFGSKEEIEFLKRTLKKRENILISGGTSTGKTVLLRSLVTNNFQMTIT